MKRLGREAYQMPEVSGRRDREWIDSSLDARPLWAERCDRGIEVLLVALLAFGPLAFGAVHAWSEQVVLALAAAMALLFCLRLSLTPSQPIVRTWAYLPVALFVGVVLLQLAPLPAPIAATLSPETAALKTELLPRVAAGQAESESMSLSFYRRATRHDLRLVLAVAAVFIVVVNVYRDPARIKRLLAAVAAIGGAVALLALAQDVAGNGKIYWTIPTYDGAHSGTFVNHSHFGQFMNLSIGAALALLLVQLGEAFAGERTTPRRVLDTLGRPEARTVQLLIGVIVVGAATVFISLTRGGMLALLIAAALTTLIVGSRRSLRGRGWVIVLLALGVFVCTLWIGFDRIYDRLASLRDIDTAAGGRWRMIEQTAAAWKRFPVFGSGLGTYEVVYPMFDRGATTTLATHAENEYVQALAETGLLGIAALLAFGLLIACAYVRVVRSRARGVRVAVYGLGFGLMAVLIHSFSDFGQHMPANAILTAVTCGLLVALARLASDRDETPTWRSPSAIALALRLVILAAVGAVSTWVLLDADRARVAESHWHQAETAAQFLDGQGWPPGGPAYDHLFEHADAATAAEPDNIHYRQQLGLYKWLSLTAFIDPNSGRLQDRARPWARQIVDELNAARPLCPTYGPICSMAGEIQMFALSDPNGAADIRQGYRLAPCDPGAALAAARLDVEGADTDAAFAKLARTVQLDGGTFGEAATLCIDDLARPDLALELAGEHTGRLSQVANLLTRSPRHGDLAEQARARVETLLVQRAEQADASASTLIAMARSDARNGDTDSAIARYRRALRKDYDQVGWHYELARLLADADRADEAIHEARICLRLRRDHAAARRLIQNLAVRPLEASLSIER